MGVVSTSAVRVCLAVSLVAGTLICASAASATKEAAPDPAASPSVRALEHPATLAAVEGEVAVKLRPGASGDIASSIASAGYAAVSTPPLRGWLVVRTSDSPARVREVLLAHGVAVSAEPVSQRQTTGAVVPRDPRYNAFQRPYLRSNTRFSSAWGSVHTSSSMVLAVLDTGVQASHPDLAGRVAVGKDEITGRPGANTDGNGHGTLVAGIAAAATDNGVGGAGAAWGGRVLPIRVLSDGGIGNDLDIARGIIDATNASADVINMSFGGPVDSLMLSDAVKYAASKGVVMVAAAGNTGRSTPMYPAAYSQVIAVAATDSNGQFAYFSTSGRWIDVAAPGMHIFGPACPNFACGYVTATGTSMAAPLVAATAMLARTRYPSDTARQTMLRIVHHAQDRGVPGIDDQYGWGLLDAAATVGAAPRQAFAGTHGPDQFEPSDAPAQATPLVLNEPRSATTAPEGDIDWFSINVPATATYIAELEPWTPEAQVAKMDPQVDVYDRDLTRAYTSAGSVVARLTPGKWYVKVSNQNGSASAVPYALTLKPTTDAPFPPATLYKSPFKCATEGATPNVAVDDVNRDGRPDVITANGAEYLPQLSNLVQVFSPATDGSCREIQRLQYRATTGQVDFRLTKVRSADIDGDGRRDLLVIGNETAWAIMNRAGRFQVATRLNSRGEHVRDAQVADVNRDGHPDLVVSSNRGIDVYYRGPAPSIAHVSDGGGLMIAVGDFTGDGRPDVITDGLVIFEQNVTGTFVARPALDTSRPVDGLAVGDLNADRRADIVTLRRENVPDSALQVRLQRSDGTYESAVDYPVDGSPSSPFIADLNGDSRPDLVVGHPQFLSSVVGYLLQQPTSVTFGEERFTPPGSSADFAPSNAFAVGDVTGDGRNDIVSASNGFGVDVFARADVANPPLLDTTPRNLARKVAANVTVRCTFLRAVRSSSINAQTIAVRDLSTGEMVTVSRRPNTTHTIVSIVPQHPWLSKHIYGITVTSVRDASGAINSMPYSFRFKVA
jgi:subtilisin family serine protease